MHSTLIFAAGAIVGAAVGIFSIAILTTGNDDEIYRRGYRDGEKDRNPRSVMTEPSCSSRKGNLPTPW